MSLRDELGREAADAIAPAWIQAHGHAQIFGWVGTFILGIGFYSIPKLRKLKPFALWEGWTCWGIWSSRCQLSYLAQALNFQLVMARSPAGFLMKMGPESRSQTRSVCH